MRYPLFLIFLLLPTVVTPQTPTDIAPLVTVDLAEGDVIVGQPTILRVKVLVPTFLPAPPVFPSLEQENLLVRLPERASGPVSETVQGDTWSGVQRSYRLYPLQSGKIQLGQMDILVTYADPNTNAPIESSVPLPPISFDAVIPQGAQNLDPLILASDFSIEQILDGNTDIQTGGAITRKLTAEISGTTPILIPPLISENQDELLRAYPKEPRFTESEDRGVLSGQRVDEVVYLAQAGGQTQLPAVSIDWFNLTTQQVETVDIPAIDLTLAAPKAPPKDVGDFLWLGLGITLVLLMIWTGWRWVAPRLRTRREERERTYRSSAEYAFAQLRLSLKNHDLSGAYSALDLLKARTETPVDFNKLEAQLALIGATRYGSDAGRQAPHWSAAIATLDTLVRPRGANANSLPPLNP
ncbi:hypothetical protein RUESEDTHA_02468 [Ruegeria sp. THAF57]|uniref:BatD family protein n=1 Tax=Ruegeria sp. THAF57 TaxID=2744555 RepID=UPI0015DF9B06|nr:BatD family protein [Ruegeria sp. THAF57]CAD0185576.1 hypothetical protein RUESEDTHA_02468 [Ruegeria sp. THAF57]